MGFAVDANILIFERFKEEVLVGKTLRTSMEAGFRRAFNTILDANVSVMIAAIVLIVMGSGTVKALPSTWPWAWSSACSRRLSSAVRS